MDKDQILAHLILDFQSEKNRIPTRNELKLLKDKVNKILREELQKSRLDGKRKGKSK